MTGATWRLSPSKLDKVRQFMARPNPPEKREWEDEPGKLRTEYEFPPYEFVSDDDLRDALISDSPQSDAQKMGTAIHAALEHGPGTWGINGWNVAVPQERFGAFGNAGVEPELAVREAFVERQVEDTLYRGRVDLAAPGLVVDFKTSRRLPDWPKLAASIQWRAYCAMLDVNHFVYRHYQFSILDDRGKRWNSRWSKGRQTLALHPPEDYDLQVNGRDVLSEVHELGKMAVAQAQRLDCAGAVMESRYQAVRNLRHARVPLQVPTSRAGDALSVIRVLLHELYRNEPEVAAVRSYRHKLASMALPSEKALARGLAEVQAVLS